MGVDDERGITMDEKSMEQNMGQNNEPVGEQTAATGAGAQTHTDAQADAGAGEQTSAREQADARELAQELNRLADAFARAAQAAWNSEQRKHLQTNLNQGLTTLVARVEEVLTDFSKSEQGQEVREQAGRVVERVRTSKVAADLQQGLTAGLRTVAEEMQEFAERMEKREGAPSQAESPAGDDAQDIPVSRSDGEESKPGDIGQGPQA
jgi:ElaB/YqjD/DUF883 family membrane-anchored ribosome-binding protein